MANQIIIDIGAVANDGTGDPLRTAFGYVNDNFSNVWATGVANSNVAFDGNKILTVNTNGNLVLAPNGTGKVVANVDIVPNTANTRNLGALNNRWSTVYAQYLNVSNDVDFTGDVTVGGNLTVTGDIIEMGNIVTDAKTIQLANTASTANAANGSGVTVGANDNIATMLYSSTSNTWVMNIGANITGNVTAPYFIGNGSQLTGITSYANANAVAYGQAGWAGNIIPGTSNTYSLGNSTNQWSDLYVSNATIYMNNVPVSLTAGNVLTVNGDDVVTTNANGTVDLANLAIDNNNIYNTQGQGVIISNFNFVTAEAETAYVQIPAGNSTNDLNVVQEQGNVRLVANSAVWNFGTDNKLTAPGEVYAQYFSLRGGEASGTIGSLGYSGNIIDLYGTNGVTISTVTEGGPQWQFDTAGNLTIPNGGYINFVNNGGITQALNKDLRFTVSDDEQDGWAIQSTVNDGAGNDLTRMQVRYDGIRINTDLPTNNYSWDFRDSGEFDVPKSIRGPVGGNLVISIGDQFGSTTFIDLQTRSYVGDALISNIRIGDPNVTVSTAGGAYNWTFGGTGNLTVPNSILGTNSGAPVVIDAGGATGGYSFVSIPSFTDGGEQLVIKNKYNSSLGIRLETESGNFTFNGTGLTFPDSTTQTTAYTGSTYGDSNVTSLLSNLGANTISSTANITTTGNISGGNIIGTLVAPNTTANTYVLYNDSGVVGGSGVFTFNENGNILTIGTTGGTLRVADISTPQAGVNLRFIPSSGTTLSYGHLNPQFANTYDLGSSSSRWNNVYANVANVAGNANSGNVYTTNITLSGTGTAVNAGQGNILTNQVTGTQFNFLNGLYTVNLNAGQATANYALRLPADAGSSNQVLTTDGTGNLSWSTPASTYGDSNVTTLLASLGSNTISTTGNITSGNLNATTGVANVANLYMNTGYVSTPASTGINIVPGSTSTGTRVWSKLVPNANVAFSLGSTTEYWANGYIGNVIATTGNFSGNVTAANFSGNISITGNVTGTSSNVTLVAGSYSTTFDNTGNTTLANGTVTMTNLVANGTTSLGNTSTITTANYQIGYRDIPQITFSANATAALTDASKHFYSTTVGNLQLTIPDNANVAFPTGATLTVVVNAAGNVIVAQGTGVTLYMAGSSTTGNRTVGAYGLASVMKVAANTWVISGTGVY